MKIETIRLQNFRCFGREVTELDLKEELTVLVGGNGSGKTAVLQAMSRLFGISPSQRAVRRRDFHIPEDCSKLEDGASLFIEAILSFPELKEEGNDQLNAIPEFFNQMTVSSAGEIPRIRVRLRATWTDDGTPEGTVEEDMRWIKVLDDEFRWEECSRVQAVERSMIQFIYLPANRDATSQVTALLKGRLWQAARWSTEFQTASSEAAENIQKAFEEEKSAQFLLKYLSKRWQEVHEADTDRAPRLRLIENRYEELVRKAEFTFTPDEEGKEHHLSELSDGQRSLFHIALAAATLESEYDAFNLPADDTLFDKDKLSRIPLTVLAIEEPENSLSPFFLSRIVKLAREIGKIPFVQVLLSSHSPAILRRIEPEEVRYCRLDLETKCSTIRALTLPEKEDEASAYVRLAVKAYPELYFARLVILGEGDSEQSIIPKIADEMGLSLDPSFVPVVPLGGRFVTHFWRLLSDLEIPYVTLLDLDLGRKHGGVKTMKECIKRLEEIGVAFEPPEGTEIEKLTDEVLLKEGDQGRWLKAFREKGVFYSYPVDLDFAMLRSFRTAYEASVPGGRGPHSPGNKNKTLKTDGKPDLYGPEFDAAFLWYPYLFLSHSKPEIHLAAFTYIEEKYKGTVEDAAPVELTELIKYVVDKLNLSE